MYFKKITSFKALYLIIGTIFIIFSPFEKSFGQSNFDFKVEISGEGEPILFIPGLISSGEVWAKTISVLSDRYECHVLTMPGYAGVPAQSNPPYLKTWKSEIIRYIKESKLDQVMLIGHSLGGFLSMWIAAENIPEVKQIILVDALPFFAGTMNPNAETGFNENRAKQYMNSLSGLEHDQLYATRMMLARGMTSDSTRWEMLTEWAMNSDLKTEAYSATEMIGIDLREKIAGINVPVLVLGAFEENPQFPGFTRERMEQTYLSQYQNVKNLRFEVADGSKHFIMYDKPEWMIEQMNDFMAENRNLQP